MLNYLAPIAKKTYIAATDLFKIMIPLVIMIKIVQEFNLLNYLVIPFYPIMELLGIPAVYSIVWLSAIFNTCYVAVTLLALFFQDYPLTVEQVSVLGITILISHSLFVEGSIVNKLKVRYGWITFIRLLSSILFGYLIHITAQTFGIMQEIAQSPLYGKHIEKSMTFLDLYQADIFKTDYIIWLSHIGVWALSQIKTLTLILIAIFIIFTIVQLMKDFNLVKKITAIFTPFLSVMKISRSNNTVTTICYMIGLSYGYGMLKEEANNSPYFKKEQPFKVITFLALAHAIVEDGLIFMFLGASGWIVILGRSLWAVLVVVIMSWFVLPKLSYQTKKKYLYK